MIRTTQETADQLLARLEAFERSAGAPRGSLDRLARGIRILAGADTDLPADPYQQPNFYIPGLAARPFWDASQLACGSRLEAACDTIRRELLDLRRHQVFGAEPEADLVTAGTWAQFDLYVNGTKLEANCALCPQTTQVLESLEEAKGSDLMIFSANVPGTHVKPHCGPHNARLRCHLGLIVPAGCSLRVGAEIRSWEEGRCTIFDDSFEHEVWNRSEGTRVVLLVDVWHPELTPLERLAVRELSGMFKSLVLRGEDRAGQKMDRLKYMQERTRSTLPADWWV